uniref:NR LBD domain-containing protein n=2 Tax=Caenorhabditis tropicalis TaxID=1561998 RepID=A0A1I7T1M8_9PELO
MNSPSSSTAALELSKSPMSPCQICGRAGHGNHFGAITCRACAAFFRDRLRLLSDFQTMDTFLGRSNLIIFCARNADQKFKYYIDLQFLLDKAAKVLEKGAETPIHSQNPLEKLAIGLQKLRFPQDSNKTKIVTRVGREEVFALWEDEFLKVTQWLTYFNEFQNLPQMLQLEIVKRVWKVFSRLEKLATTAIARRQKICDENMIVAFIEKDLVLCDLKTLDVDLSWCTKYTFEQLKFFNKIDFEKQADALVQPMLDLQPTDVELSYMLCQLCFHQLGKHHQGVLLEISEQFQDSLSNHLHDYYVNSLGIKNYVNRIASMMKINNKIQNFVYHDRVKQELMRVFDIFHVKYSHPDLFQNS